MGQWWKNRNSSIFCTIQSSIAVYQLPTYLKSKEINFQDEKECKVDIRFNAKEQVDGFRFPGKGFGYLKIKADFELISFGSTKVIDQKAKKLEP